MPIKYIGKTHDFYGKTLWEIVGNLKNFGIGRIVTRSRFERYPEPTYMKILKVETLPKPENESMDNVRKVRALVQKTFRGKTIPKPILIESASYKTDYKLVPKDEEANFSRNVPKSEAPKRILPRFVEFPPLMKELIRREAKIKGMEASKEELELEVVYNLNSKKSKYRIAEKGEKPTETVTMGLGKPVTPRLYKGLDL